uniref:Nuclear envelope integral membrane protein 1 n=1 Tax=Ciona savignyi TaxID=51511 RepID=H2YX63_CIOSA
MGLEVLLVVLLISAIHFNIGHAQTTENTERPLNWHDSVKGLRGSNSFHISALKNPAYSFGCIHIKASSNIGDFDLDLDSQKEAMGSSWYGMLLSIGRYFRKKSATKAVVKENCISPFNEIFVNIKAQDNNQRFSVQTHLRYIDVTCCVCLLIGIVMFYTAAGMSRSVLFYYTSGISIGVVGSLIVIVFIISRYLPKKPAAYATLIGGWSVCAWLFAKMQNNLLEIVKEHYYFALGYVLIAGFASFAVCYKRGPVSDPRSQHIIQWMIQLVSLLLVYNGSQLPKVSITIMSSMLVTEACKVIVVQNIYFNIIRMLKKISFFQRIIGKYGDPPPRKLLTQDEYYKQGQIETEKALAELRNYCQSPQCSPWKTLANIESPKRFASFIEGDSHLVDAEVTMYEQDMQSLYEEEKDNIESFMSEDESEDPIKLELELSEEDMGFDEEV